MGIHEVLEAVTPVSSRVLGGLRAGDAGDGPQAWRTRFAPEVVALLSAMLEGAWLLARVDGTIDPSERATLSAVITTVTGGSLRTPEIDDLLDEAATKLLQQGLGARCAAVGEALAGAGVSEAGLRVALAVAAASYGVSLAESVTAAAIARAAGIDDARADEILRETLAALAMKPGG
jgi:molecular chaperone DnaK (HSP70)